MLDDGEFIERVVVPLEELYERLVQYEQGGQAWLMQGCGIGLQDIMLQRRCCEDILQPRLIQLKIVGMHGSSKSFDLV